MRSVTTIFCFTLLFSIFSVACRQSDQAEMIHFVKEFPRTTYLSGEPIFTANKIEYNRSTRLSVLDTFLVVLCLTENGYIDVYSTNSLKLLGELSGNGRGPGEFVSPHPVKQVIGESNNNFHVYDESNMNLTKIDIAQSILQGEYVYEQRRMDFFGSQADIIWIYHICDEVIGYRSEQTRLSLYKPASSEVIRIPYDYPEPAFPVREEHLRSVLYSDCVLNSELGVAAVAPRRVGQLEFFGYDGKHKKTVMFCDYEELTQSMQLLYDMQRPDLKIYTNRLVSNGEFIFLLNWQMTVNELLTDSATSETEILVFDWSGNPVQKFVLDRHAGNIAVDFERNVIYATCLFEKDFSLVSYSFSLE